MRAAVDAGSIVSFVAGLDEEEKSDVIYSVQLAQRAASAKHDRFAATKDWYGLYVDVLGQLGWAVEALAFAEHGASKGEFSMDKSALDVIATIATGAQLAILVKTIDTLKKLGEGDRALHIRNPGGEGSQREFPDRRGAEGGEFRALARARRLPLRDRRPSRQIPVLRLGRGGNPLLDSRLQDDPQPRPLFRASQSGCSEAEGRREGLRGRAGDRVARRYPNLQD